MNGNQLNKLKKPQKNIYTSLKPFKGRPTHSEAIKEFEKEQQKQKEKRTVPRINSENQQPALPKENEKGFVEKISDLVNGFVSNYIVKPIVTVSLIISSTIFPMKSFADDFSAKTSSKNVTVSSFDPQGKEINTIDLDSNVVKQAFEVGADTTVDMSRFLIEQVKAQKTEIIDSINTRLVLTGFDADKEGNLIKIKEKKYLAFDINDMYLNVPKRLKINENIEILLDFDCGIDLYSNGKKIDSSPGNSGRFYRSQGIKYGEGYILLQTENDKIKFYNAFVKLVQENVKIWSYKFKDFDNNEKEFLMLGFKGDGAMTDYIFWMFVPGQEEIVQLRLPYIYFTGEDRSPPGFLMDVGFTFYKGENKNKLQIIDLGVIFAAKSEEKGKRTDWGYLKAFRFIRESKEPLDADLKYSYTKK